MTVVYVVHVMCTHGTGPTAVVHVPGINTLHVHCTAVQEQNYKKNIHFFLIKKFMTTCCAPHCDSCCRSSATISVWPS